MDELKIEGLHFFLEVQLFIFLFKKFYRTGDYDGV